jgi:hypothetical protein
MAVTSTRREALRLYRDLLKICKRFTWTNNDGILWSKVLKESVQTEFRQSKYEMEPEMILRMIFTGREALKRTEESLELKRLKLMGFQGETMEDAIAMSEKAPPIEFGLKRS